MSQQQQIFKNEIIESYVLAQQNLNSIHSKSKPYNTDMLNEKSKTPLKEDYKLNGFLPLTYMLDKSELSGISPYWLSRNVEKITGQKIKNYSSNLDFFSVHFADKSGQDLLTKLLGAPDGWMNQQMLTNRRTVVAKIESEDYFLLKFPNLNLQLPTMSFEKYLNIFNYNLSVGERLKSEDKILKENKGSLLTFELDSVSFAYYNIQRTIPFQNMKLDGSDLFLPLFSLYSPMLKKTEFSEKIYGTDDFINWFQKNISEKLINIVLDSYFNLGIHFELHQQNISVLLQNQSVSDLFVHDLFDVIEDPIYQALLGLPFYSFPDVNRMSSLPICGTIQNSEAHFLNQPELKSLGSWYREYLRDYGEHEKAVQNVFSPNEGRSFSFSASFNKLISKRLNDFSQKHSPILTDFEEYEVLMNVESDFYARLNALREVLNISLLRVRANSHNEITNTDEVFNILKNQKHFSGSHNFILANSSKEFFANYNSWLIEINQNLKIILQKDKNRPKKFRYLAIFLNN
jgi:hypothetical protein